MMVIQGGGAGGREGCAGGNLPWVGGLVVPGGWVQELIRSVPLPLLLP